MNVPYRGFNRLWPKQAVLTQKLQAQGFSQQGAQSVAQGQAPKQPVDKLKVINTPPPPPPAKPAQTASQGQGNMDTAAMSRLALAKLQMSTAQGVGQPGGQGQAG